MNEWQTERKKQAKGMCKDKEKETKKNDRIK